MVCLQAWVKSLTTDQVLQAERELGETPEIRRRNLTELKRLIREEEGFKPLTDDAFLVRFLRAKKYDVKRAFKTLKNYYGFKTKYSGVITNFTPNDLQHILEMNKVFISPKRCPRGGGILIVSVGSFDPSVCTIEQLVAASLLGAEIGMETEASQVCGSSVVIDLQGASWSKLKSYCNPSFVALLVRGFQDCWPYRIIGFHIVNEPSFFGFFYNIVKPVLTTKIKERTHFHSDDLDSLHRYLPPEVLPEDLGGHLGEKEFTEFRTLMLNNQRLMERLNRYVYQRVKSPGLENYVPNPEDENETTESLFQINFR